MDQSSENGCASERAQIRYQCPLYSPNLFLQIKLGGFCEGILV